MHRILVVVAPVAIGVLVAVAATATPASAVHGDVATGLNPPAAVRPTPLSSDYRIAWTDRHRAIRLRIRDGAACPPGPLVVTSTAPARIEVTVGRSTTSRCSARPRWWVRELPTPTVAQHGQGVSVWVDGMRGALHGYRV